MHGSNGTRAEVGVYAKRLTDVLGEEQVTAIARRSGWLRRARKVMPLTMALRCCPRSGRGTPSGWPIFCGRSGNSRAFRCDTSPFTTGSHDSPLRARVASRWLR
jgi:hypothetical protein